jgi:hypothetical protein
MGRVILNIAGILLLILALAIGLFAISEAGSGLEFVEYGQFLVLAAALWAASHFVRKISQKS